jgi:hypothetical protein
MQVPEFLTKPHVILATRAGERLAGQAFTVQQRTKQSPCRMRLAET